MWSVYKCTHYVYIKTHAYDNIHANDRLLFFNALSNSISRKIKYIVHVSLDTICLKPFTSAFVINTSSVIILVTSLITSLVYMLVSVQITCKYIHNTGIYRKSKKTQTGLYRSPYYKNHFITDLTLFPVKGIKLFTPLQNTTSRTPWVKDYCTCVNLISYK